MEEVKLYGVKMGYLKSKLAFVNDNGELLDVVISPHKKHRSLNANAYCWVLINDIANVLHESKEQVYRRMLFDYGYTYEAIVKTNVKPEVFDYYEYKGRITLKGQEADVYRVAMGSSKYDTRQMSNLIDGIIHEAQNLEITTLPNEEIEKIKGKWSNE